MFQNLADDRLPRPPDESSKCDHDGKIVVKHVDCVATCTRRQSSSVDGLDDHIKSHLD
jgi:hypothetical protein